MDNMESLNKQEISFLKEQITRLEATMTTGFATLNAKLELMNDHYIKRVELREAIKPLQTDIDGLKDDRKWAIRIVLGILITAIIGTVVTLKLR